MIQEEIDSLRSAALSQRRKFAEIQGEHALSELSWKTIEHFLTAIPKDYSWVNKRVGLYRALTDEVSLDAWASFLIRHEALIYYPKVIQTDHAQMEFFPVPSLAKEHWLQGEFGILEPKAHTSQLQPDRLDWIFVPSVLVGKSGERIGRGAGFYDRYLIRANNAIRVSLVYDFQLMDELPQNTWDQRMNWVVTDSRQHRYPNQDYGD